MSALTTIESAAETEAAIQADAAAKEREAKRLAAMRQQLAPAKAYLESAPLIDKPGLVGAAKVVHLTIYHFHRRFHAAFGVTPKDIVVGRQIAAAKEQLLAGRGIEDVAHACGFAHQSHFTARFKQAVGSSPGKWLKAQPRPVVATAA